MVSSDDPRAGRPQRGSAVGIALTCVVLFNGIGYAQHGDVLPSQSPIRDALERPGLSIGAFSAGAHQLPVESRALETPAERRQPPRINQATQPRRASRAPSRRGAKLGALKAVGAIVGMMGGFHLGGKLGAAIEGDSCRCDDPGLQGFLIGAGVGAVGGAILGTYVTSR